MPTRKLLPLTAPHCGDADELDRLQADDYRAIGLPMAM
jgi:hypothetical protein